VALGIRLFLDFRSTVDAQTWADIARGGLRAPSRVIAATVVGAFVSAATVQFPTAQVRPTDQTPTFRVRADVVRLDVSVLDRQGHPVRGLTAGDFAVLEDGLAQPIVAFAAVDVPTWSVGTAPWMREVGSDVASNRIDGRRAVVIVMDDYGARFDPGVARSAKAIAGAAIDQLGPADLAAVVYVLNRDRGQEFTLDRGRLRAAVDRFVPSGLMSSPENLFSASTPTDGLRVPSSMRMPSGACSLQDCIAQALRNVGDVLGAWPGARKTVVLVSPGPQSSGIEDRLAKADERGLMFAALQNANVNVYQFDPNGLQTGRQTFSNFGMFAENTGGRAITDTNAPEALVPEVFHENSSYYLLGVRTNDNRDGRFHRINVQVNRPGVRVRTRAGYYAPTERRPAKSERMSALERALSGGMPSGDLSVSVTVAPFATPGKPGAALAVVARLDHDADVAAEAVIELVAAAFNSKWKQVAAATQRFVLPPANAGAHFSETALRLNLPPGRYEVRAAMRNTADNRTGSVYASVTVPDFGREPLSLSGIAVERRSGRDAVFENLAGLVPVRMTTGRLFSADERVAVVARVYQRRAKVVGPVHVSARIVDGQDRAAFTAETIVEASAFGAERQADYRLDLPLDRLSDGEYLLTLDASTGATSARRTSRFTVRR
jgi:VWFA-related protein